MAPNDHATRTNGRFVGGLSLVLLGYSSIVQLVPGYTALYVPLNLAATAIVLLAAHGAGLGFDDIAARTDRLSGGLRWGFGVGLIVVFGLTIGVAVPAFHPLLQDERVGDIGCGLLAYRTLVRIPFGTVILEEVAFRGVLFGALQRWAGLRAAVIGSSAVFGLWHIRPAVDLVEVNSLAASTLPSGLLVGGAVVVTGAAGILFCWLRIRSGSLLAPIIAHAVINSSATAAAFVVLRW